MRGRWETTCLRPLVATGWPVSSFLVLRPYVHGGVWPFVLLHAGGTRQKEGLVQFTDVAAAPLPALKLLLDDVHHKVVYQHRIVALSPAEYRLFYALWLARERCWQSGGRMLSVLSTETLAHAAQVPAAHVQRLVSRANHKLEAQEHALVIVNIRTIGYELRRRAELALTTL